MLKNLSLRTKLLFASLSLAILLASASYYQIYTIQNLDNQLHVVDADFAREIILSNIDLVSSQLIDQVLEYQQATIDHSSSDVSLRQQITITTTQLTTSISQFKILNTNNLQQSDGIDAAGNQLISIAQQVVAASVSQASAGQLETLDTSLASLHTKLVNATKKPTASAQQELASNNGLLATSINHITQQTSGFTIVVAIFIIGFGLVAATWISHALLKIKKSAQRIANGDFSELITVTSSDELGQLSAAFNSMATRLKDSYRRLAIERQRDDAILHSMGEGLIATDEKQHILLINPIAAQLLDLQEQAVMGKPLQETYQLYKQGNSKDKNNQALPIEERPAGKALATGQNVEDIYILQRQDGSQSQLSIHASPIQLGDQTVGAVIILRDVTREKEVDRMKTEFISLASHQLRTPLSAIKWFTEMLVSGDAGQLQSEQLDFAHNIADSTERMISLVNALLNISRIESGRIMIEPKPTDLKELVAGIINDLKGKTEAKKQTLIVSVHSDLPKINLDPHLVGQVYLNLLTNAIKYTPKGGEINVFISKKDDQVVSQVTDNGYGIPKEQQKRVFEKFFRATNAVKVETDGTGLGLYLIKAVVESSGGKIWFESQEGKGSTFWFSIPLSGMKAKEGEVTLDA